ncbi:MAG: UDP-N-acetylmuramoyl-tripeptide--D-alanyl-D-alanine ligase [Bacteroidota bacterium]|nr:UDP-N-acetylmuramoyl-tripeptide--D-alanyl-D-alanine ligase [Bacteroidota bacterium]
MIQELYNHFLKHPVVCTDTRDIKQGSIFFALKGDNFNANKFAEQALDSGCSLVVIDEVFPLSKGARGINQLADERYFLVEDVLFTLQALANHHRKQLSIPIISITGTNGKTTSKELLNAVLSQKYNVLATKGNLNNHIGVPLTLLNITKQHEIAIVEMGANHVGEISMLCAIAEPDFGMITNIGKAHLEGFGGYEGVVKAKSELYQFIQKKGGKLFVNADNKLLQQLSAGIENVTFGTLESVDFEGQFVESNPFVKLKFKAKKDIQPIEEKPVITTQLIGNYNFENILAAACIGHYFDVSDEQIKAGLENYVPANNRSQVMQTKSNLLLLDAYNANPSSMNAAIENFAQMDQPNKMAILGDMLELGDDSAKEHDSIVNLLKNKNITNLILVGPFFKESGRSINAKTFSNSDEVVDYLKQHPVKDSTILIKGSRGIKLEKVVELL